jgi:hypothetical protein
MSDTPVTHFREMVFDEKGEGLRCDIDFDGWIPPQDPMILEPTVKLGDGSELTLPAEEHDVEFYLQSGMDAPAYRNIPSLETQDEWLESGSFEVLPTAYWPNESDLQAEVGDTIYFEAPAPSDIATVESYHWTNYKEDEGHAKNGVPVYFRSTIENPSGIKGGRLEVSIDGINPLTTQKVDEKEETHSYHQYEFVIKDDMPENTAELLTIKVKYIRDDGLEFFGNEVVMRITNTPNGTFHYDSRLGYNTDLGGFDPSSDYLLMRKYDLNGTRCSFEAGDWIKWRKLGDDDWTRKEIKEASEQDGNWKYTWDGDVSWPTSGFYEFKEVKEDELEVDNLLPEVKPDVGNELPGPETGNLLPEVKPDVGNELPGPETGNELPGPETGNLLPEVKPDVGNELPGPETGNLLPDVKPDVGNELPDTPAVENSLSVSLEGPTSASPGGTESFKTKIVGIGEIPAGTVVLKGPSSEIGREEIEAVVGAEGEELTRTVIFSVDVPTATKTRNGDTVEVTTEFYTSENVTPISDSIMVTVFNSDSEIVVDGRIRDYVRLQSDAASFPEISDEEVDIIIAVNSIVDEFGATRTNVNRSISQVIDLKVTRAVAQVDSQVGGSDSFEASQLVQHLRLQASLWRRRLT